MKKIRGKHMKRKKYVLTERFWALMITLLGVFSIFLFKQLNETDVTGPIFIILIGLLGYIGSFGED